MKPSSISPHTLSTGGGNQQNRPPAQNKRGGDEEDDFGDTDVGSLLA